MNRHQLAATMQCLGDDHLKALGFTPNDTLNLQFRDNQSQVHQIHTSVMEQFNIAEVRCSCGFQAFNK